MSLTAAERETVVTVSDGDDLVHVWTAQASVIRRLTKDDRWTLVGSGEWDGSPWAKFTIPARQWNPLTGTKRKHRELSPEAREKLSARLARGRNTPTRAEAS